MRHRWFVCFVLMLCSLVCAGALSGCARATTPAEAAAIEAADNDPSAYTLAPDKLAKSISLTRTRNIMHFGEEAWGLLQLWLLLELGFVARIRNVAVNLTKKRWGQCFIFFFEFLVLTTLLNLPLTFYSHHVQTAYGLSVQHWGSFLFDELKSFALTYVFGGLGIMLLFWRIRKSPRTWWLQGAVLAMIFATLGIFITPYVIDPLFNKFEPLSAHNAALVDQLEKVVARGKGINIPPERMFLMKASDKVTTLNAYVTGFGSSKRVVVWDTSIAKGTPDEISFIFGHEMGHYVLGHIVLGILFSYGLILVSFFLGFHLVNSLIRTRGAKWRVPSMENWAALVVLMFAFSLISLFIEPVANTFSRSDEHAADVYGQEAMHGILADPQSTAQASFQLLGENSFADPYPSKFIEFWTYNHPAILRRAAFAKHYDPWAPGASPKYFTK